MTGSSIEEGNADESEGDGCVRTFPVTIEEGKVLIDLQA